MKAEPLNDQTPPPPEEDAALLLAEYLDSGRGEAAFARLVARTAGMVYGSALRRTGDAPMAEEVMQNVFTLLARKAASLRRHPSLAAWIFQTTRYEAAKAMRAENRRRKKLEALAEELARDSRNLANPLDEEESAWREALPALYEALDRLPERERALVLERFFEGRKFSEIAVKCGRSEAACKMGIKRTLEKLSRFLTSRGVTLSATAVASALMAEFARSAPLQTLAAVASKALATSGGLTASALITNTVQTMSTLKTATLTGAAVLAVVAVPLLVQEAGLSNLRGQLSGLEARRNSLVKERNIPAAARVKAPVAPDVRTAGDLIAAADEPLDVDTLMNALMEFVETRDTLALVRIGIPLARLEPKDYHRLIADIGKYHGNAMLKQTGLQMLEGFAPVEDTGDALDRMIGLDLAPSAYAMKLHEWADQDPEAAIAWFEARRASGQLAGKGVSETPEAELWRALVPGIARKDPARALTLFEEVPDRLEQKRMAWQLGADIAANMRETRDDTSFRRMLAMEEKGLTRIQLVCLALSHAIEPEDFGQARAFIETYLDNPGQRRTAIVDMLAGQPGSTVAARGDWLLENVGADALPETVGSFVERISLERREELKAWVEARPDGPVRDHALHSLAGEQTGIGAFREALASANLIAEATLRDSALEGLAIQWMARDAAKARAALPPDLLERLEARKP